MASSTCCIKHAHCDELSHCGMNLPEQDGYSYSMNTQINQNVTSNVNINVKVISTGVED